MPILSTIPEQRTQVFSRIDYTVQLLTIILQFLASSPSNLPPRGLRSGSVRTSVMGQYSRKLEAFDGFALSLGELGTQRNFQPG